MANDEERIGEILENCLRLVETGRETVETVLSRYPDLAEQLRPPLEAAAWMSAARRALDPRPGIARASRQRLVARIQQAQSKGAAPPAGLWARLFPAGRPVFQMALALVLLAALLVVGQTSVLAAQAAVPGDALYPLKLIQEEAQLGLTFNQPGDARLRTRFARRRLIEIEALILEGRYERIPEAVANYEEQVAGAIASLQETAEQDPAQAQALASGLQEVLLERTRVVSILAERLPGNVQLQVEQVLLTSREGFQAVQALTSGESGEALPITQTPGAPTAIVSPVPSDTPAGTATRLAATLTPVPSATPQPTATANPTGTPAPTLNPTAVAATLTATASATQPTLRATPAPPLKPAATPTPTKPGKPEKPTKEPRPSQEPKPTREPKEPPVPTRRPPKP